MALGKSKPGWQGWKWCVSHCLIYTACVALLVRSFDPLFLLAVGIPHLLIDRWSLASWWLTLIRGRTFKQVMAQPPGPYREISIAFMAIVYVVVDNSAHLAMIWAALYLVV